MIVINLEVILPFRNYQEEHFNKHYNFADSKESKADR